PPLAASPPVVAPPVVVVAPPVVDTPPAAPAPEATVEPPVMITKARPCTRRRDGLFALGCSKRYLICTDGRPAYNSCTDGFAFDEPRRTCMPKRQVRRCWRPTLGEVGEAY
uniref:Chitin-binding type-2 domain-containing protein n=1 Tax=Parascaris univalens TaxID=6257 RepID=A0A915BPP8_PARUN